MVPIIMLKLEAEDTTSPSQLVSGNEGIAGKATRSIDPGLSGV